MGLRVVWGQFRRYSLIVGAASCLGVALAGCTIGRLSAERPDEVRKGLRDRAEDLSHTAWASVRSSGSRLSAWATILMEGSSKQTPSGFAASAQNAPATSYLAHKAREHTSEAGRLSAVVSDVKAKTAEADAFIAFAQSVRLDAQARIAAQQAWAPNAETERQRRALAEDKRVVELAVADLRLQKATFAEVERELRAAAPTIDTSPLKAAIDDLGQRITRLSELALAMDA